MLKISVKRLREEMGRADALSLPDMNPGIKYLYDTLYHKLSHGEDARLSEIDFDAFKAEDIGLFNDMFLDIFEKDCYAADRIICMLRNIEPVCKAVYYI